MSWLLLPCAAIGFVHIAAATFFVVGEMIRAIRQSGRVAAICIRLRLEERRRPTIKERWFAFRNEFFSSYSSLIVGFVEIPRDPSKPIRARLPR